LMKPAAIVGENALQTNKNKMAEGD